MSGSSGCLPAWHRVAVPTEDDLPPNLRSAWNHGKHEARTLANQALQEERAALEQGRAQLSADQAELAKREEQWVVTNAAIEKALAETREASEALRGELASAQGELAALRSRYDTDVDKLQQSLESERCANATSRAEHGRALQAREDTWRQEKERLEAREIAHERRFLAEVDQARQGAKVLEAELAKERRRRLQVEEAAAVERKTHWVALDEAKQLERKLREELQSQAVALAQTRAQGEVLASNLRRCGGNAPKKRQRTQRRVPPSRKPSPRWLSARQEREGRAACRRPDVRVVKA